MHVARMEHLVEVLKRVDSTKYRQDHYGAYHLDRETTASRLKGVDAGDPLPEFLDEPFECHTSACALGWAAFDPEFQAQGLSWKSRFVGAPRSWESFRPVVATRAMSLSPFWSITFNGKFYDDAGQDFFELTNNEEELIFGGDHGRHVKLEEKIAQIEDFLKTGTIQRIGVFQ